MFGIPYFGYIVIAVYSYNFLKCLLNGKSLYELYVFSLTFSCCLEVNNLGGYMLKTNGGYEIAYNEVVIGLTSIIALFMLISNKKRMNKKLLIKVVVFHLIIFLGIVFAVLFPSNAKIIDATTGNWDTYLAGMSTKTSVVIGMQTYLMLIRCIIISLLLIVSSLFITKDDYQKIISCIVITVKIHLLFVLFEYITQTFLRLSIASQFRETVFGLANSTYTGINFRGSGAALQGLTKEPSHLSDVLVIFVSFIILTKSINKNRKWLILTAFLWLVSGSFSAVMYIAILVILYFVCNSEKGITINNNGSKIKIESNVIVLSMFIVVVTGFIFLLFNNEYLIQRTEKAFLVVQTIFNTGGIGSLGSSSETARIYGAFDTIRNVLTNSPLLGFGLGTATAHSGIACVLGQIGILGLLSWIQLLKQYINFKDIKNKNKVAIIFLAIFILPNILKGGMYMVYSTYIIPMLFLISTYSVYAENKVK